MAAGLADDIARDGELGGIDPLQAGQCSGQRIHAVELEVDAVQDPGGQVGASLCQHRTVFAGGYSKGTVLRQQIAGIADRRAQRDAGIGGDVAQGGFDRTGLGGLLEFIEGRAAFPERLFGAVCTGFVPERRDLGAGGIRRNRTATDLDGERVGQRIVAHAVWPQGGSTR